MAQLDSSRRHSASPKTSSPASVEQFIQAGDPANLPVLTSPSSRRDYEQEEEHTPSGKKSVLAKVREKAKKWRQTLAKKKQSNDESATPAWGVSLEDDDGEEEAPEFLGAPMYESEMAPEGLKETARQHPRADPVIPENHALPSNTRDVADDQQKESDSPLPNNIKTIAETVTEKLTPAYTTVADATQTIASKIQGCVTGAAAAPQSKPITGEHEQVWDKGVSVKEYLMNKLEPGDDERALSQVISEVISPRKSPGEMGVVEKVREAVTLLLRNGEHDQSTTPPPPKSTSNIPITCKSPSNMNSISTTSSSPLKVPASSTRSEPAQTHLVSRSASQLPVSTNSASQVTFSSKSQYIPISTNAYEVNMEEESHGRILQTN